MQATRGSVIGYVRGDGWSPGAWLWVWVLGLSLFAVARVNHGSRSQGMMIPRYK
jgi:hypothetical protein